MEQKKEIIDIDYKSHILKMLSLVDKSGCIESEEKINDIIGYIDESDKNDIILLGNNSFIRGNAFNHLKKGYIKNEARNSSEYDKYSKKIKDFKNSLVKTRDLMNDETIKEFMLNRAAKNREINPKVIIESYSKTYQEIKKLSFEMEAVLDSSKSKGRPSLKPLYAYVYELASLYQELSSKKFTVFRNKDGENCKPVSPGHEFVYEAIQLMNEEVKNEGIKMLYSDSNIYNACEEVQKNLKPL